MKDFINEKVKLCKPSGIRKFFDIASEIEGCISLGVGEPDFDTPWHIREAAIQSLKEGKTYYTSNAGLKELRIEICKWLKDHYSLDYRWEDEVIVTTGASEAVDLAFRSIINPGDEVIVPTPCYVSYEPSVILCDGIVKTIQLKNENQFRLTPQELEEAITPKTKAIILNYPNNPTGGVMSKEDLEAIAKVIIKHDLFVISDEIYSELSYGDKKHFSIGAIDGMKERSFIINGFSKAYSMTGWRLGYICGPKEVVQQMYKIHQYAIMAAQTTSQFAGIEALKNGDRDVQKMRNTYDERRKFLLKRFEKIGLPCFTPLGAFYAFPDIRKFGMSSEEFCLKLLEQEKVVVVPGNAFGEAGEGFIRISYAYSIKDLSKALDRIEKFIKNL